MLRSLQSQLLHVPKLETSTKQQTSHRWQLHSIFPKIPTSRDSIATRSIVCSGIPPLPKAMEPFHGAWLQVGDIVDGRYKTEYNEWYKGVIVGVEAFEGTISVKYLFDGELDRMLCRDCVRPFRDYRVGETIDYLAKKTPDGTGLWQEATIRGVLGGNKYRMEIRDAQSRKTGDLEVVKTNAIRRFIEYDDDVPVSQSINLGETVEVRTAEGWALGVVLAKTMKGGIMYYSVEVEELDRRDDAENGQHQDRQRRRMGRVEKGEGHFPDVVEDQLRRVVRSALGQDEQMVDQLDRIDHCIDRNE